MGEDFLDLAVVDAAARQVRLGRVAVAGVEQPVKARGCGAIGELGRRLLAAAPELGEDGAIALVDSPRWPRDLDLSTRGAAATSQGRARPGRAIDACLRAIVIELGLRKRDGSPFRLAMFPTPTLEFFAGCVRDPGCKPHLAALGRELFGAAPADAPAGPAPSGGRVFTRFMIAGFAAYRALETIGAESFEAYPDLTFRLWARGDEIPPKGTGRTALEARRRINERLADEIACAGAGNIWTLDQADAAVLALSAGVAARAGVIGVVEEPQEGRFALALDLGQAVQAGIDTRPALNGV